MKINKASFVAGAGSAVLLGAALIPSFVGAQTADETPSTTATAEAGTTDAECGPALGIRGFGFGLPVTDDLATALGVTVEDLQAAAESVRETYADTERPETEEEREALKTEMQAAFASALGVSVTDLETAIDEVKATKQAEAIARVQEKVADGTLTQEEADAIIERIESGERPFGFGPGGRGGRGFGERFGGFGEPTLSVTPDA